MFGLNYAMPKVETSAFKLPSSSKSIKRIPSPQLAEAYQQTKAISFIKWSHLQSSISSPFLPYYSLDFSNHRQVECLCVKLIVFSTLQLTAAAAANACRGQAGRLSRYLWDRR